MNKEDRVFIAQRLVSMQQMLRTVIEHCDAQAQMCDAAGAKRLALAVYMLRENMVVYSSELNRFVLGFLAEEDLAEEEYPLDY